MPLSTSAGNMDASIAAIAANHTYGATAIPPGYVLVTTAPSPTSDLIHPEVWKNSATGDVIIAFRGTELVLACDHFNKRTERCQIADLPRAR